MHRNRFYVIAQSNDIVAYAAAYQQAYAAAHLLAKSNADIQGMVFVFPNHQNALIGKELLLSATFGQYEEKKITIEFVGLRTYLSEDFTDKKEVVICCGLSDKQLFQAESNYAGAAIIAMQLGIKSIDRWLWTWRPREVSSGIGHEGYDEPDDVLIKQALFELNNLYDELLGLTLVQNEAKACLKAMIKFCTPIDTRAVSSFLITKLGWQIKHALTVERWLLMFKKTRNVGPVYHGYYLREAYDRWKKVGANALVDL